jgi:hypothetical protein
MHHLLQAQLDAITGDLGVFRQENLDLRRRLATAEAEKVYTSLVQHHIVCTISDHYTMRSGSILPVVRHHGDWHVRSPVCQYRHARCDT